MLRDDVASVLEAPSVLKAPRPTLGSFSAASCPLPWSCSFRPDLTVRLVAPLLPRSKRLSLCVLL